MHHMEAPQDLWQSLEPWRDLSNNVSYTKYFRNILEVLTSFRSFLQGTYGFWCSWSSFLGCSSSSLPSTIWLFSTSSLYQAEKFNIISMHLTWGRGVFRSTCKVVTICHIFFHLLKAASATICNSNILMAFKVPAEVNCFREFCLFNFLSIW